jgi:hypothetical protein
MKPELTRRTSLGFGTDRFQQGRCEGRFPQRRPEDRGADLNGEKLHFAVKGTSCWLTISESQLDLSGSIELPMQGNKRVTLAINGTLGNPKTKIL